jgi:hypothetical protein
MNVPGPAKYNLLKTKGFGQESIKYSINPETKFKPKINKAEPGPGQYESCDNSEGNYPISSLRNTVNNLWSSSKVKRFNDKSIFFLLK